MKLKLGLPGGLTVERHIPKDGIPSSLTTGIDSKSSSRLDLRADESRMVVRLSLK